MQSEFECKFNASDELLKEYCHILARRQTKRICLVSALVLCFVILSLCLKSEFDKFDVSILSVAVAIVAVGILTYFFTPKTMFDTIKQYSNAIHDNKIYETNVKFGDKIYMSEGNFCVAIRYSQIFKIHKLKRGFAFMFGASQAILIDVSEFSDDELLGLNKILSQKFINLV